MKVYENIPQGTSTWMEIRSGLPTASQASKIITPSLKRSSQQDKYIFQLLAERLMLQPATERPASFWWAQRGVELEQDARNYYSLTKNVEIRPITFVVSSNGRYGASPDGFCDPDGMCEFKCENEADHLMYVMQDGALYEAHALQVQMQLLVCEDREWDDLIAYHPLLPQAVHRTYRDEDIQAALRDNLERFCDRLDTLWEECVKRGYAVREHPYHKASMHDHLMKAMKDSLIEVQK